MLFFPGKSCCVLCGGVMSSDEDMFAFPVVTANMKDPLYIFNDAGTHRECYQKSPYKNDMDKVLELWHAFQEKRHRCDLCNEQITNPDELFGFDYLTLDENDPLYKYNSLKIHIKCIPKIQDLKNLLDLLKNFHANGEWNEYSEKSWVKIFDLIEENIDINDNDKLT